jgi:hypothetical protein
MIRHNGRSNYQASQTKGSELASLITREALWFVFADGSTAYKQAQHANQPVAYQGKMSDGPARDILA